MRTGVANLALHGGKCPRWLFPRMVALSKAISIALIEEFGHETFLKRISDPYWFHSLGCIIGYDWNSSGLTTTTLGALKEGLKNENIGITIAGGKGKESKKTIQEIENTTFSLSTHKIKKLQYSSKITAKVDNCLLQDNYQIYHHSFIFDEKGSWAIIQQGMNPYNNYARRYHWLSSSVKNVVSEPHQAICCNTTHDMIDLTAKEHKDIQKTSVDLVKDNPVHLKKYFNKKIKNTITQKTLTEFSDDYKEFIMPQRHHIIDMKKRDYEMLRRAYKIQPKTYEELLAIKGFGAKTIRSLALISSLIYGNELHWKDPTKYSFAHGGKDAIPYPVDSKRIEDNSEFIKNAIKDSKAGNKDKIHALKKLNQYLLY